MGAHEHPYGSARYAEPYEIARAGLFQKAGAPFGYYNGRELFHCNGTGVLITGGAGSMKTTAVQMPMLLRPGRVLDFDPKGEKTASYLDGLVHFGGSGFCINPYGVVGLPQHKVSLLSHLKRSSPTLVGDSRKLWMSLLPNVSGTDNRFFDETGRRWGDAITRGIVAERTSVSLLSIYQTITQIRSSISSWIDRAAVMAEDGCRDLEAVFGEMISMEAGQSRTYDSVMSGLTNAISFMADPANQSTFVDDHEADFTLDVLTQDGNQSVHVSLVMPPDLIGPNAPVIRQTFSTARTLKQRKPGAQTVRFGIDEAAALGPFEEISELFSIGRGMGTEPWAVYQNRQQITKNLGRTGADTLSANAGIELTLGGGVRDLETAQYLSRRMGNATIRLDDRLTQERAKAQKRKLAHDILFRGLDPVEAAQQMRQMQYEAEHETKMSRSLMEPDEILNLDANKTIVMAGGYQLPPFLADKVPYWKRRDLAGLFFPNPYVTADMHSIEVPGRLWSARHRILEESVPSRFAHLPQYKDGRPLRYVEGFKPRY